MTGNSGTEGRGVTFAVLIATLSLLAIQLITISPTARPMWDEAYYLWSAERFSHFLQETGVLGTFQSFRTGKPWFMEFLLSPFILLGVEDIRAYIFPAVVASSLTMASWFRIFRFKFSLGSSTILSLALITVPTYYFHSFSTQTEIFICLAFALGILATLESSRPLSGIFLTGSFTIFLLTKQSNGVAVALFSLIFLTVPHYSFRSRCTVLAGALLGAALLVFPAYFYNYRALLAHMRTVGTMGRLPPSDWITGVGKAIGLYFPLLFLSVLASETVRRWSWKRKFFFGPYQGALLFASAASFLIFGFLIGHNPVKYFFPYLFLFLATLVSLFSGEMGDASSCNGRNRTVSWIPSLLSLLLFAIWGIQVYMPMDSRYRAGFTNKDLCFHEIRDYLRKNAEFLRDPKGRLFVIGDNAYLNYSSISWLLEQENIPSERLQFLPPGSASDAAVEGRHTALLDIGLTEVINMVSPLERAQSRAVLLSRTALIPRPSCRAEGENVDIFDNFQ